MQKKKNSTYQYQITATTLYRVARTENKKKQQSEHFSTKKKTSSIYN